MELIKQISNLELSRRLEKLGVKQESEFYWVNCEIDVEGKYRFKGWHIVPEEETFALKEYSYTDDKELKMYSAFTSAELGEMLPRSIKYKNDIAWLQIEVQGIQEGWSCQYHAPKRVIKFFETRTMSDCMAKMLIYLLENKLIEL